MDTALDMRIEDRFVTIDGLNIRYIERGEGAAVILLHGASLGSSADVFLGNLGPLAEGGRPTADGRWPLAAGRRPKCISARGVLAVA